MGSAVNNSHDQILDSILLGPINVGSYKFVFQAKSPDWSKIPPDDLLGVTAVLLSCNYKNKVHYFYFHLS